MARVKQHTVDAVVTEMRVIFGVGGLGIEIRYIEQEHDAAGTLVRQEPEARMTVTEEDLSQADRAQLETRLQRLASNWLRRYT